MADETNTAAAEAPATDVAVETPITPLNDLFSQEAPKQDAKAASPATVETETTETTADTTVKDGETPSPEPEQKPDETVAKYEARIKETRIAYDRMAQEKANLERQVAEQARYLEMINKKIDGNWTDEDEKAMQPQAPSPEEAMQHGQTKGKIDASREAAYEIFGEDEVNKTLFAEDAPFRAIMDDPIVSAKILNSNAPVIEAMKIVQVKQFYDKWGYEPATIEKNMREAVEKELTDKITQKVIKQMQGRGNITTGIRDVKSVDKSESFTVHTPLKELFG